MTSITFKTLSAFLSIPFMYAYYWLFQRSHIELFGNPYPLNYLMYAHCLGLFLHMSYYTTERTEVKLCGKETGIWLEHGWIVLANFLHVTVSLFNRFALVFGLHVLSEENAQQHGRMNADVFADQRYNKYNVNVHVGPLAALLMRISDNLNIWIFKVPHLIPMRLGFFIMWVTFGLSMFHASLIYSHTQASQAVSQVASTVQRGVVSLPDQPTATSSGRVLRLNVGNPPIIPDWKAFNPILESGTRYYGQFPGDERKYLFYNEPAPDHIDSVSVVESLCSLIPKGRTIFYWTATPPTHASNVDDEVKYMRKKYGFTLGRWFDGLLLEPMTATWAHVRGHWGEVETSRNPILSKAMETWELSSDESGGIVCF
jgi:hypothetical protein